ncbi:MAG: hypothetical protein ACYC5T_02870 [Thiobacillus sp.]
MYFSEGLSADGGCVQKTPWLHVLYSGFDKLVEQNDFLLEPGVKLSKILDIRLVDWEAFFSKLNME